MLTCAKVSNLERQLDRYRKAQEAAAAHKQGHGMQVSKLAVYRKRYVCALCRL